MSQDYKHLHELEDQLIQIMGLMEALQILLPDGSAHSCVANSLEEKLLEFKQSFYEGR